MSDSGVDFDGVSGELTAGDIAGRDIVKKESTVSKAVDAMAAQSAVHTKSSSEIIQYLSQALIEAQQEATRANQLCSQRLNEQAKRHQQQLDANAKADRKRSEWFEGKLTKYDDSIKRILKEKEHAYQAMQDSQEIVDAQRGIINMQKEAIDELKHENKLQAKQINDLNNRVAHLENGGAENFHKPE